MRAGFEFTCTVWSSGFSPRARLHMKNASTTQPRGTRTDLERLGRRLGGLLSVGERMSKWMSGWERGGVRAAARTTPVEASKISGCYHMVRTPAPPLFEPTRAAQPVWVRNQHTQCPTCMAWPSRLVQGLVRALSIDANRAYLAMGAGADEEEGGGRQDARRDGLHAGCLVLIAGKGWDAC